MSTRRATLGKTTRPTISGILPRKRLFDLIDEARKSPAIWVSGPPGCGKTTAVASYLDHAGIACLWYQVDEGDADVATFFYYLGLAAAGVATSKGRALPLLTPEFQRGLAAFTRRYFQELYARVKAPFAVVFDGCQEVPPFSPFHEAIREAVAELPPGGCAFLISRGDPPPTLARLRANRAVATLGWEDLRLTAEETRAIALKRRRDLPSETIDELYAKTQGWAAGLVLLLEQTKMPGSIAPASLPAGGQLVFDYLAGEIFQKSDAGTQEFLLRTAYPSFLTPSMARALTGAEDAEAILEGLHRNNYFVSQRPGRPEPVYQYHPMMREFLRARLEETYSREKRHLLLVESARVMEGADVPEDALALYREAHEWDEMARIIAGHAEATIAQGRGETVRRWIEDLPPDVPPRHPWIVYWAASSQAQLAPRESRQLCEKAFDLFAAREPPERTGMMLASSGALDAILYELDDLALMDRWIAVLDEAVKGGAPFPSAADEARVACSMFIAATLRQPHRPDIPDWIARALAKSEEAPDPNLRMFVGLLASLTCMWAGLYETSYALLESMRKQATGARITPFSLTTLKNVEAMYYMLTADPEKSLRSMREGLEIMRATGAQTWLIQLHVNGYGAALAIQDLETAATLAKEFESQSEHAGRFNRCLFHHFRAWEAMLRKDPLRALQDEKQALRMAVEVGCPFFEVLCRLALAEILAEFGDERKAISHLQQLRSIVAAIDNRHLEFTCLIGFGRLAMKHGRQISGIKALRRGLALGREHGYHHFLGWRPSAVSQVCAYALEAGIEVDYVRDLIRRRNLAPDEALVSMSAWPWTFRVRMFGAFELLKNDEPLATSGKAQKRPLELLKVLLAAGGEKVSESQVTEAMWPRIDGDSAHRSFTSTLHRLRKMLGEDRAIVLHEGRLTVERRYFWVDAWEFSRVVEDVEAAFRNASPQADSARAERLSGRLIELYRGPMLAPDLDEAWLLQPRERQRARFIRAMTHIGRHWEQRGEWDRALACYERCLEVDPLAEAFYRHLIIGLQRQDRRGEAIEAYHRCRKALVTLGVEPSPETRALYEALSGTR